jgi:hypothetical protein
VRRRSCGATSARPHFEHASFTTPHITFGLNPFIGIRPALLIPRKIGPLQILAADSQDCRASPTQFGIGTVRICRPFPTRSAKTQCSSVAVGRGRIKQPVRRGAGRNREEQQPLRSRAFRASNPDQKRAEGPCPAGLSQFPIFTPCFLAPFTRRIPAARSGLSRPASAAS